MRQDTSNGHAKQENILFFIVLHTITRCRPDPTVKLTDRVRSPARPLSGDATDV